LLGVCAKDKFVTNSACFCAQSLRRLVEVVGHNAADAPLFVLNRSRV
jgi:hypothetical protein